MKFFVYIIKNNINNKVYIGKTSNIQKRFAQHLTISKFGKTRKRVTFNLIHAALLKYGKENFSFSIIKEFDNESQCLTSEKCWIEYYKSNVNKYGNKFGYNLTDGGDGKAGYVHNQKSKDKISSSLKGRKFSEEHKLNLSQSHKKCIRRLNIGNKIIWPNDQDLLQMVKESNYTMVAKLLNVSNVAVRERLKRRNLL